MEEGVTSWGKKNGMNKTSLGMGKKRIAVDGRSANNFFGKVLI